MKKVISILLSSAIICGLFTYAASAQSSNYKENDLLEYAKNYLSILYEDNATGEHTYNDVRFLLADVSGDNEPELLAVGVFDNEMRYLEIYRYENGNIIKILDDYFGYAYGKGTDLAWYDGGVRVFYGSGSSGTGFLNRLMKYNNGNWVDVYNSYVDIDFDNSGEIKGYIINDEYVSEEEFDRARENAGVPVELSDFSKIDTLLNNNEKVTVTLNGTNIEFDQPPIIKDDRTLVPLRAIFEALGATVDWNGDTKTVTAIKDNITVTLTIGDYYFYKNGKKIEIDVPGIIVNGRTLVPVRAISEAFDCNVEWDGENKTVNIAFNSSNYNSDDILTQFLQNRFEKEYLKMQSNAYLDIDDDNEYFSLKQNINSYSFIDLDSDGDNELIISSTPIGADTYMPRCISAWDCDEEGNVMCVLAKAGQTSRAAYRYFIIKYLNKVYLLESTGESNSAGHTSIRNLYEYDSNEHCFNSKYKIYYRISLDATFDPNEVFTVNNEHQTREYVEDYINNIDQSEFLYKQFDE